MSDRETRGLCIGLACLCTFLTLIAVASGEHTLAMIYTIVTGIWIGNGIAVHDRMTPPPPSRHRP